MPFREAHLADITQIMAVRMAVRGLLIVLLLGRVSAFGPMR